jgi:hypothetical protein
MALVIRSVPRANFTAEFQLAVHTHDTAAHYSQHPPFTSKPIGRKGWQQREKAAREQMVGLYRGGRAFRREGPQEE